MTNDNVVKMEHPSGSPTNGGSGNGGNNTRERIARIEAKMEHVAMKEDVLNLKIWILSSVIAGMLAAAGLTFTIIRVISVTP